MPEAVTRRIVNELGNRIVVNVRDAADGMTLIEIEGPTSTATNEVTAREEAALRSALMERDGRRQKATYVGAPAIFALELACHELNVAFGGTCYLVGSAVRRADWRDVDICLIMKDEAFAALFPAAQECWEHDPRWLLMVVALSDRLSKLSGVPVDFKFQPMTHANTHKGARHPLGLRRARAEE